MTGRLGRFVPLLVALAVGTLYWWRLAGLGRLDLLLVVVLLSFLACQGLLDRAGWSIKVSIPSRFALGRDVLFALAYVAALTAMAFGGTNAWMTFADWNNFSTLQFVRLTLGLALSIFLPGYALVEALSRRYALSLPFAQKTALAFVGSVAINTIFQYTVLLAGLAPEHQRLAYVVASAVALTVMVQRYGRNRADSPWTVDLTPPGLLLGLIVVYYLLVTLHLDLLSDRILVLDFAQHVSRALSTIRTNSPAEELTIFNQMGQYQATYTPFYGIFWSFYIRAADAPAINAAYVLDPLLKIPPVLAFYALAMSFNPKQRWFAPLATLVYFAFGGSILEATLLKGSFGQVIGYGGVPSAAAALDTVAARNFDLGFTPIYYDMIAGFRPLNISFTSMLLMIQALIWSPSWPPGVRIVLLSLTAFAGLSLQVISLVVFCLVILPGVALARLGRGPSGNHVHISLAVALTAIAIMDALSPLRFFLPQAFFWLTAVVVAGCAVVDRLRGKTIISRAWAWTIRLVRVRASMFTGTMAFLYLYSWTIWLINDVQSAHFTQFIPWFHLPVRFGIAGLAALLAVVLLSRSRASMPEKMVEISLVTLLLLTFSKAAPRIEAWTAEYRLLMYPHVGIALLAATLFTACLSRAKLVLAILLSIIILESGLSEGVLAFGFWRTSPAPSTSELSRAQGVMEYLFRERSLNEYVAALDHDTRVFSWFSGAFNNHVSVEQPIFAETDPLTVLSSLRYWRVRHVVDTQRGRAHAETTKITNTWGYEFTHALPVLYSDAYAKVRAVPPIIRPRPGAPLGLLYPDRSLLPLVAFAAADYDVFVDGDDGIYRSKSIGTSEPAFRDLSFATAGEPLKSIPLTDPAVRWSIVPMERGRLRPPTIRRAAPPFLKTTITVSVGDGGTVGRWMLRRPFSPSVDISSAERLRLAWRGNGTGALFRLFMVSGKMEQRRAWTWTDDFAGWKTLTFPVSRPDERLGDFDPYHVTALGIEPVTSNASGEWEVGWLGLDRNHEIDRPRKLLDWVSQGGLLIVGGSGSGPFQKLLGIEDAGSAEVDAITVGRNPAIRMPLQRRQLTRATLEGVRPLANYMRGGLSIAPLAYEHRVGRGRLIYIDVRDVGRIHGDRATSEQEDPVTALSQQLLCGLVVCQAKAPPPPVVFPLDYMRGLRLKGTIIVEAPLAGMIIDHAVPLRRIHLGADRILLNGSLRTEPLDLRDAVLLELTVERPLRNVLEADSMRIGEEGAGPYVVADVDDQLAWRGEAGQVRLFIQSEDGPLTAVLEGKFAIQMTGRDGLPSLIMRGPRVSATGKTQFDWGIIFSRQRVDQKSNRSRAQRLDPWQGLVWETAGELQGTFSFSVESAGRFLHLTTREFSGDLRYDGRVSESRIFSPEITRRELHPVQPSGPVFALLVALSIAAAYTTRAGRKREGGGSA